MGLIKHKGRYVYDRAWHQDWSALIIPKAAEAALVHGKDIREFITNHPIDADFHMRGKIPRSSQLVMRWPEWGNFEVPLANIVRYYVSTDGGYLFKKSPPTGTLGAWKRKSGITDAYFESIQNEIMGSADGFVEEDSLGIPHDERIHTKNKSKHGNREQAYNLSMVGAAQTVRTLQTLTAQQLIMSLHSSH